MKVEVTVELDINLTKVNLTDVKKIFEEMINAKEIDAFESISIKDVKLGK